MFPLWSEKPVKIGSKIINNKTGEALTMIESEEDKGGARPIYEVVLPPRRASPPLQHHIAFTAKVHITARRQHGGLVKPPSDSSVIGS